MFTKNNNKKIIMKIIQLLALEELALYAMDADEVVPSEHATQLFTHHFSRHIQNRRAYSSFSATSLDELHHKLVRIINLAKDDTQYLILMETGQRKNKSTHFTPIVMEKSENQATLLILDHYKGHNLCLEGLPESAAKLNLALKILRAGGEKLQKDYVSCLFYSLSVLRYFNEHKFPLSDITPLATTDGKVDWCSLPPELSANAQSVRYLHTLVERADRRHLTNLFARTMSRALVTGADHRVINRRIATERDQRIRETGLFVHGLDENTVFEIIFSSFPKVSKLLREAAENQADAPEYLDQLTRLAYQKTTVLEAEITKHPRLAILLNSSALVLLVNSINIPLEDITGELFINGDLNVDRLNRLTQTLKFAPLLIALTTQFQANKAQTLDLLFWTKINGLLRCGGNKLLRDCKTVDDLKAKNAENYRTIKRKTRDETNPSDESDIATRRSQSPNTTARRLIF